MSLSRGERGEQKPVHAGPKSMKQWTHAEGPDTATSRTERLEVRLAVSLQQQFVESRGAPITVDGRIVVQIDRLQVPSRCRVVVAFVGSEPYEHHAAVLAVRKPGKIFLSDGSGVSAVAIWDQVGLPRLVEHDVDGSGSLEIYNKYRTRHGEGFVTEDSFTGNAGMIVSVLSENARRYECSGGMGDQSFADLVFEVSWEAMGP